MNRSNQLRGFNGRRPLPSKISNYPLFALIWDSRVQTRLTRLDGNQHQRQFALHRTPLAFRGTGVAPEVAAVSTFRLQEHIKHAERTISCFYHKMHMNQETLTVSRSTGNSIPQITPDLAWSSVGAVQFESSNQGVELHVLSAAAHQAGKCCALGRIPPLVWVGGGSKRRTFMFVHVCSVHVGGDFFAWSELGGGGSKPP